MCLDDVGKVNGRENVHIVNSLLIPNPNVERKLKPVPCKLRDHFSNWQKELVDDFDKEFLLNGVLEGFHILENKTPEFEADMTNYESASVRCKKAVEDQINVEIKAGNYVISSLGAIPKPNGSVRIIHDLSRPNLGVNQFVIDSSCHYSSVDFATKHMEKGAWLSKIDLASAYRSIPIHPECYTYMGLSWIFENQDLRTLMVDAKLPFGSRKACQIFTKITDESLEEKMFSL